MENLNLILFICLAIPISMMLLLFKGHSRMLCSFLIVGMFMCVLSGEINALIQNSNVDYQTITINIAPLVEESLKALPIIFFAYLLKLDRQTLSEYALSVGVGFATLENMSVLITTDNLTLGYALIRAIGAGMMHGVCTLIIGRVISNIVDKKVFMFSGTLAALSISIIFHSIYNMLISSEYMVLGAVFPTVTFVAMIAINILLKNKKRIAFSKRCTHARTIY